ncbi:unnamed protein product [Notodromas monacha]|uniref:tryptophan--tRNA ligase n=1 Tax=Notodromas monacha TaxID=399045 RepID=A0A7R9BEH9_9CRUS|nr:unnamed protein product [Notodromas monacha]CAG0913860.1 unnamed protein product [Notodromas monacha]
MIVRRIFSGIQPTGLVHLGNYFGAVKQWKTFIDDDSRAKPIFSIVDLHAITLPQNPAELRNGVESMAASLIACGIDPAKCILFRQSDVGEHTSLSWVLGCLATLPRLSQLPQFKEKSEKIRDVPLGLYVYPVLQSADILLYKATDVPVGEDNLQNVYFAQHMARVFNHRFGTEFFPRIKSIVLEDGSARIRSLRNPEKKMSKSDPDPKSRISIIDSEDEVVEKCRKAVTDFTSEVYYDLEKRPGVSNLILLHSLSAGITVDEAVQSAQGLDTGKYKLHVAEAVNEHLKPIRETYSALMNDRHHLREVLSEGAQNARSLASETWQAVRSIAGLSQMAASCQAGICSCARNYVLFYAVKTCRVLVEFFAKILFSLLLLFRKKRTVHPVKNELLLDGAVTLARKIRTKEVLCVTVVEAYIERIHQVNPYLRCISDTRFLDAILAAQKVDELLKNDNLNLEAVKKDTPFLGVPFTVKEALKLKGCASTVGLLRLADHKAEEDADAVISLIEAGAIPLGTTSIPEMCMWWETYNLITGLTKNPYDTRYSAGGSSGGEGSAIAACASPMGLGTDLGGSVRIPSLFNGICGHKGSPGLVSSGGHCPDLSGEMNEYFNVGPMARYAEDVLEMFKVLTRKCPKGLQLDRKLDLKKLRYFTFDGFGDPLIHETDRDMKNALKKVIEHLKAVHSVEVKKVQLKNSGHIATMWGYKIAQATKHNEELLLINSMGDQAGSTSILREWLKFIRSKSQHTYPLLYHASLQRLMFKLVDSSFGKFMDEAYENLSAELLDLLGEDGVLLYPTFPHKALPHKQSYFFSCSHGHSGMANILKLPATHLPVGFSDGLPLGITIMAGRDQDAITLGLACALEKGLGGYVPPSDVN